MENEELQEEFKERVDQLKEHSDLINEEIGLMTRILQIRQQFRALGIEAPYSRKLEENIAAVNGHALPKRRGRPPGSKNRPKGDNDNDHDEKKALPLYALLETISMQAGKPLTHAEFVEAALQTGYQSKAADFSNMVYQSLLKLVKGGSFSKNDDDRTFAILMIPAGVKPQEEVPVLPNENGIPIED
jgi:hypothetical protein